MAEFQPTQFQPVSFYDLPTLAFSQVVNGQASLAGFSSLLSESVDIGSNKLTPSERTSIVDEYKKKAGIQGGLSGALIDIATNPWVWLSFLATPSAVGALKTGAKATGIFDVAPKYHAYVRENAPFLLGWNFLTGNQLLMKTPLRHAMREASRARQEVKSLFRDRITEAERQVIDTFRRKGIKIKSLDWRKAPAKHREEVRRAMMAVQVRLQGLDRSVKRGVAHTEQILGKFEVRKGEEVLNTFKAASATEARVMAERLGHKLTKKQGATLHMVEKPGLAAVAKEFTGDRLANRQVVDSVLRKYQMHGLVKSYRKFYDEMALKNFFREDKIKDLDQLRNLIQSKNLKDISKYIDEDKVINLWRSAELREGGKQVDGLFGVEGRDNPAVRMIQDIMRVAKGVEEHLPSIDSKKTRKFIRTVMAQNLSDPFYTPRLFDQVNEAGKSLTQLGRQARTKEQVANLAIAAGNVLPKVKSHSFFLHSADDLKMLRSLAGSDRTVHKNISRRYGALNKRIAEAHGVPVGVTQLDPYSAIRFYENSMGNTYSLFIHGMQRGKNGKVNYDPRVWDEYERMQREALPFLEQGPGRGREGMYSPEISQVTGKDILNRSKRPLNGNAGYYNIADIINQGYKNIAEPGLKGVLRDGLVPHLMGRSVIKHTTENMVSHMTRAGVGQTAAMLKKMHLDKSEAGKKLIGELEDFSNKPQGYIGAGTGGGIAKYLYTTHLGMNPAAIVLNLSQPWLLGATFMGVKNTLAGYGGAFKELSSYLAERVGSGRLIIDDSEKALLIKKHFKYADEIGISPDTFRTLDDPAYGKGLGEGKGSWDNVASLMMRGFEKAEWLNRLVTAHAVESMYKGAGRLAAKGPQRTAMLDDMGRMVQETQFGSDILNSPMAFLGHGPMGAFLGRPEIRQFLTFPTRSVTGALITPKQINAGHRSVMGYDVPYPRVVDFVRGMGISSMLYYTGRNMFDADMSKGLFVNSITDIVGGDPFNDYESPYDVIPVPPVLDITYDAARGLISGDMELMAHSGWRLVPGGIGISRGMGAAPPAMGLPRDNPLGRLAEKFQRRYADYSKTTPNGLVPVFKGDGTFVEFQEPASLIMKSLGLDLNKSKVASEGTGYLVKQREEILKYRHAFLNRMLANDIPGALSRKAEFEKRFKFPLSISKQQLRQFMRNRLVPRDERILDRIPPEGRREYAKLLTMGAVREGADPQAFVDARTTSERRELMNRQNNFDLNPETINQLKQMIAQAEEREKPTLNDMGFDSYGSF